MPGIQIEALRLLEKKKATTDENSSFVRTWERSIYSAIVHLKEPESHVSEKNVKNLHSDEGLLRRLFGKDLTSVAPIWGFKGEHGEGVEKTIPP